MDRIIYQKHYIKSDVGISEKKADYIISKFDEDILWSKDVLGFDNPKQLLYTVMYVTGLNFALDEHGYLQSIPFRTSNRSQFLYMFNDQGVRYLRYIGIPLKSWSNRK